MRRPDNEPLVKYVLLGNPFDKKSNFKEFLKIPVTSCDKQLNTLNDGRFMTDINLYVCKY